MNDSESAELLRLVRENNEMLRRIVAYLDKVESDAYKEQQDAHELMINVLADVLVGRVHLQSLKGNQ